jgi:hypothetical protein
MIFIWTGKGFWVLVCVIADFILTASIGSALGYKDNTLQIFILEFVIAVIVFLPIWFLGKKWNAKSHTFIEKETGKEIVLKNRHKVFWIPMQYWAIIYPILIVLISVLSLTHRI